MKILLIEDNPGDADLVSKALSLGDNRYEVQVDCRLHDALNRDLSSFDIVLADLSLPDSSGLDGVKKLRSTAPDLPVVVLTSLANDAMSLQAIKEGAQDYIVKDTIDHDVLERSIRYAVQRQRQATDNRRLLQDLQNSKALLERKNQRLERLCDTAQKFVDNVSHEFRTPLTVIMEYAALISDGVAGEVTEQQQQLLGIIDDRACDLNTMVDDMLDVSKLESGLLGACRHECKLADIVEHVFPALRRKALVRGVVLETKIAPDLPKVFCDEEKIGRVLVNLVVNAIKFAREPGRVTIWANRFGDHEVQVGVSDNGPGIPAERREEIFMRFSQVRSELKECTKGFGLGLNIAKELVDLSFGRMGVESEPGVGSTFTFTVPISNTVEVTKKYLHWLIHVKSSLPAVSAILLRVSASEADQCGEDVEAFLYGVLRQKDIAFRCRPNEWLLLVNTPEVELEEFRDRLFDEHVEINRNRPTGKLPKLEWEFLGARQLEQTAEVVEFVKPFFREPCHV